MTSAEVIARAARAETRAAALRLALSQILTHMEEIDDELDALAAISDTARRALEEAPDAGLAVVSAEDAALGASAIEGYALAVTGEIDPDEADVIDRLRQAARRLDFALPERTENA